MPFLFPAPRISGLPHGQPAAGWNGSLGATLDLLTNNILGDPSYDTMGRKNLRQSQPAAREGQDIGKCSARHRAQKKWRTRGLHPNLLSWKKIRQNWGPCCQGTEKPIHKGRHIQFIPLYAEDLHGHHSSEDG
ncbi:Hypothetical predicted protein, partial [Pelobates cultripes]